MSNMFDNDLDEVDSLASPPVEEVTEFKSSERGPTTVAARRRLEELLELQLLEKELKDYAD